MFSLTKFQRRGEEKCLCLVSTDFRRKDGLKFFEANGAATFLSKEC